MTKILRTGPVPLFASVGKEFNEVQNRLRRLLGPEFGFEPIPLAEPVGWVPTVEIAETEEELVLTAELPGMTTDNVEITFEDDILRIRGEKKDERKVEKNGGARYHLWERNFGTFERSFALPRMIDPEKLFAEMKNGILTIHMPKADTAKVKGRKIEIAAK
jgi:HSP20 family protein